MQFNVDVFIVNNTTDLSFLVLSATLATCKVLLWSLEADSTKAVVGRVANRTSMAATNS